MSAADVLSNASAWISRAPAAAFRSEHLRLRAVWAWLCGLFRPGASIPATASPRTITTMPLEQRDRGDYAAEPGVRRGRRSRNRRG